MNNLDNEQLITALHKIHAILAEQGVPKGSVKISFDEQCFGPQLQAKRMQHPDEPFIVTPQFSCHFGGCNGGPGIACCTF